MSGIFVSRATTATTPLGQAMIKLRYSLSTMPEPGFRPRYADDRVGHFMMVAKDFSRDDVDTRYIRYVTRWRLEKEKPSCASFRTQNPDHFLARKRYSSPLPRLRSKGHLDVESSL